MKLENIEDIYNIIIDTLNKNGKNYFNGFYNDNINLLVEGITDKERYQKLILKYLGNTISNSLKINYIGVNRKAKNVDQLNNPLFQSILLNNSINGQINVYLFSKIKNLRCCETIINLISNNCSKNIYGFIDRDFDHENKILNLNIAQTMCHDFETTILYIYIKNYLNSTKKFYLQFHNKFINNLIDCFTFSTKQGLLNLCVNNYEKKYNNKSDGFFKLLDLTQDDFINDYAFKNFEFEKAYENAEKKIKDVYDNCRDTRNKNYLKNFISFYKNNIGALYSDYNINNIKEIVEKSFDCFNNYYNQLKKLLIVSNGHILLTRMLYKQMFNNYNNLDGVIEYILSKIINDKKDDTLFDPINSFNNWIKTRNNY